MLERTKKRMVRTVNGRKFPPQFRMYLKETDLSDWGMLKKIARRECRPMAEIVRELVCNYVRLHEPGNPQQRLDNILALGKAYNANGCFECGKKPLFSAGYKRKQILLCKVHLAKYKLRLDGWREL